MGRHLVSHKVYLQAKEADDVQFSNSVLTGITHNFVGALLTRFFLGFIEAAFLPGALYLLSCWYTKREIALRYTILYSVCSHMGFFFAALTRVHRVI